MLTALQAGTNLQSIHEKAKEFLAFAQSIGFRDGAGLILSTERLTAALQGLTKGLSDFSDENFDEAEFTEGLKGSRMSTVVYWHWTRKLMAHFLAGEDELAVEASRKGDPGHWIYKVMQVQNLDYQYFSALAIASFLPKAQAGDQPELRRRMMAHHGQIKSWAEGTGSATFADKLALTEAEIARIEGREGDAERLYEKAIQAANASGFIHNEALAYELAARFHRERGFERTAIMYLREARTRYRSWGAFAKVRQLDNLYPRLGEEGRAAVSTGTSVAYFEHLELASIMEVSQAISGEMVLETLVRQLMQLTMEHAGAERVVLFLSQPGGLEFAAEATIVDGNVLLSTSATPVENVSVAHPVLQYVMRKSEILLLGDATRDKTFGGDPDIRERRVRSLLCMPLISQGKLAGLLYMENNLAADVFTPSRLVFLRFLSSQAAMALENARLYRDLRERESRIRRLVDSGVIGIVIWESGGRIIDANDMFLRMTQYERSDIDAGLGWFAMTPPEWQERVEDELRELSATGEMQPREKEFFRRDGSRVKVLIGAAAFEGQSDQGVAYILDLTERERAETKAIESERRYRELQSVLAHANRVETVGQLSTWIAHDIRQPLVSIVTSAGAGLRWIAAKPPNLEAAGNSLRHVVDEGHRASQILERIRAMMKKTAPLPEIVDINSLILETLPLLSSEIKHNRVEVVMDLSDSKPRVNVDPVQLQQVLMNLVVNAIDAMSPSPSPSRLVISTKINGETVVTSVSDNGPALSAEKYERFFEAFFTTKENGLGMGLAICQTIIEGFGGSIWAKPGHPQGANILFSLEAVP